MIRELILRNRSYRRFQQDVAIETQTLRELVDLARLSPSAGNVQPLKFLITCDAKRNELIFPHLAWAAYLKDWSGPEEGERPVGYIVILGDKRLKSSFGCDPGIAAQSILLGAAERGLGGCIIASIQKQKLIEDLQIAPDYDILLVIALGRPKETVVIDEVGGEGDIKYWRDNEGKHHVPKRSLDEIIIC